MGGPAVYLVSVGPSPTSEDLIRQAVRLAREVGASLVAVHVDTPAQGRRDEGAQERLEHNLAVAELLGAEVVVLEGDSVARELSDYAQARGAAKILVGRNRDQAWRRFRRRPVGTELAGLSAGWDLEVLDSRPLDPREEPETNPWIRLTVPGAVAACAAPAVAFAAAFLLRDGGANLSVQVLCFVAAVVLCAGLFGLGSGVLASVFSVLAFNFGFTEPLYTLSIDDPWNGLVFVLVLLVGTGVGLLTDRLGAQTRVVRNRERRLAALYRLGRDLALAESQQDIQRIAGLFLPAARGVLKESMETLVSSARDRVDRAREAQAALFLEGLSHDLRTPLAVIATTVRSVVDAPDRHLTDRERNLLTTVEQETLSLANQLETLLDLVRLQEAPQGRWEWVPAEEILFSCRDSFGTYHGSRPLLVSVPPGLPLVRVEPTLVERALVNLLDNADRYSPPGLGIGLSYSVEGTRGEFRVSDRGNGVPDDEKVLVFGKFYRGRAVRKVAGSRGTGLGLALVAEVARFHGGSAGVRDREGGGAEFWVSVPIPTSPPEGEL